jgi:hypothetical protein
MRGFARRCFSALAQPWGAMSGLGAGLVAWNGWYGWYRWDWGKLSLS